MISRVLGAGLWLTGALSLCHMLVWPIDGLWVFRGAFTVFSLLNAVYALSQRRYWRLAGVAGFYAFGWLAVLGWYLVLYHAVHQEPLEARENQRLGQLCQAAVAELSKSESTLEYAGIMAIRGPEKNAAFFENFSKIWDQFFHLGDFRLLVRCKGKIVEVAGNRPTAQRVAALEKNPDPKAEESIQKEILEKIRIRLSKLPEGSVTHP